MINTDGGQIWGPAKNFTISGNAKLGLLDVLIAEGKKQGRYYSPDPHPEAGHFYRSDHFSFAKVGVPAISFGAGNDLVNGGIARGEALGKEYVTKHYHQPSDEWSTELGLHAAWPRTPICSHLVGRDLANSREWPDWSRGQRIPRRARPFRRRARQQPLPLRLGRRAAEERRARLSETLEPALPDHLDEQAERLMHRFCDQELTVATAESCTGGMLAALFTDIEGAGHGFDRGFVTYRRIEDRAARDRTAASSNIMKPFPKWSPAQWRKARSSGAMAAHRHRHHRLCRARGPRSRGGPRPHRPRAPQRPHRPSRRAFRCDRAWRRSGEIAEDGARNA